MGYLENVWGKYRRREKTFLQSRWCGEVEGDVKKSREGMVSEQGAQGGCRSSESVGEPRGRGTLLHPQTQPWRKQGAPKREWIQK